MKSDVKKTVDEIFIRLADNESIFDKETYGTLLSTLATNPNGGTRTVFEVILIVNPVYI